MVSAEDVAKAEGELKVATASIKEAEENREIAQAELDLAKQTLEEHTIKAPFDGIITKRMRNPGESVRANEAVVELGNLNRLAADAYVPIEYAYRVKEGQVVEIQPQQPVAARRCPSRRSGSAARSPSWTPRSSRSARPRVRIRAEFENPGWELRPGLEGQMTIFLHAGGRRGQPPRPTPGPGRHGPAEGRRRMSRIGRTPAGSPPVARTGLARSGRNRTNQADPTTIRSIARIARGSLTDELRSQPRPRPSRWARPPSTCRSGSAPTWSSSPSSTRG